MPVQFCCVWFFGAFCTCACVLCVRVCVCARLFGLCIQTCTCAYACLGICVCDGSSGCLMYGGHDCDGGVRADQVSEREDIADKMRVRQPKIDRFKGLKSSGKQSVSVEGAAAGGGGTEGSRVVVDRKQEGAQAAAPRVMQPSVYVDEGVEEGGDDGEQQEEVYKSRQPHQRTFTDELEDYYSTEEFQSIGESHVEMEGFGGHLAKLNGLWVPCLVHSPKYL